MKSTIFSRRNLRRLIESPVLSMILFQPIINAWRLTYLRSIGRWYGGQLALGRNIKINHPTLFQGRGRLVIESNVQLGYSLAGAPEAPILLQPRQPGSEIYLGENCQIMNGCEFIAQMTIEIGRDCMIGPHTLIYDSDFHGVHPSQRRQGGKSAPVVIEENVWIGSRVMILKGVRVGKGSVIAASSIVTRDVEPGTVVGGNPARVIGYVEAKLARQLDE